jgi:glycosyltransferase involved in cell wall biosynthesis
VPASRLRIVQAAGWYLPSTNGGTEVYVSELSSRLCAAGHDVRIAAPETLGQDERTYELGGLQVYRYPIPAVVTRDEAQGRITVRGADRFHDWLRDASPDIVHMHTFVTGLGLAELRVARSIGAKVIVTTHSASLGFTCQRGTLMRWGKSLCDGLVLPSKCAACQLQHRGLARPIAIAAGLIPPSLGVMGRSIPGGLGTMLGMSELITHNQSAQHEMLNLVDRFVVLSDWARTVLIANGAPPEKIALNRLGVRFPQGNSDARRSASPLTVAYVGRFESIKGVTDFARAISLVPRSAQIKFEFHGPVQHRADLAVLDRLKALVGPDAWVTFGGELDATGVRAVLDRVDVICCPSRAVEGGPTIALEAHAAGVPVVGSNIPALSEVVRDGVDGRLYEPGDAPALAAIFTELSAAPETVDRWRASLPRVRTMDDVTQDYLSLYAA